MDKYTEYYREQFYQEARDIIEKISDDILQVEADPDNQELLNAIFRGIHTIKGSAGSFDLEDISEFAHHFESLLSDLRDHRISLTPDLVDVILSAADHIGKMVGDHEAGRNSFIDKELLERFKSFCSDKDEIREDTDSDSGMPISDRPDVPLPPQVREAFQEAVSLGLYVFRIRVRYSTELFENGYDSLVFLKNLKRSCTFYYADFKDLRAPEDTSELTDVPCIEDFKPLTLYLHPTLFVATALSAEDISDLTFDPSLVSAEAIHIELDDVHSEPIHEFIDNAVEMLESMEKAVIDYETSGSRDSLNEIFRAVHNFKGDADLVGLQEITVFAHTLESLLERLRGGTIHRTFALIDVILQSVDFLRQSVVKLGQGVKVPEFPPIFKTLEYYASMKDNLDRKQSLLRDVSPEIRDVFTEQTIQYKDILFRYVGPGNEKINQEIQPVIERALKGLANASQFVGLKSLQTQSEKAIAASKRQDTRELSEATEKIIAFINGLEADEPEQKTAGRIPTEARRISEKAADPEIRTMRIDERKVDHFTNMVGELLIARNTYDHLVKQLEDAEGITRCNGIEARKTIKALKENLHLFSRLTNDIHHGIMSLRMIPVKKIFQKFNRTIRDISRRQKKSIQLLTGGEEIEIDKKVSDMLSEPLVHLVRNACDHGIESTEERKACGKPEGGTVIIRASQEGSNICISVIDDGRGIDREALYEKARKADIAVDLPDALSLADLVFMPGLSTRNEVSDISGRGVGMDVVRTTVRSLGGMVRLISNIGKGTEVKLSIPTSLGIDSVLFVEAGGISYAISLEHIVETLKIPVGKIKRAGQQKIFHHRGEVLPVERLEILLSGSDDLLSSVSQKRAESTAHGSLTEDEDTSVVIVKTTRGKYGLIVDCLNKNMEVAVKPPPGILAGIDIISGVSIMGDGRVFLVLNPEKFF